MQDDNQEIEIRSEEVQDILTKVPNRIVRWGSMCILFVLLIFVIISSFVKYPTLVLGDVKLTTKDQPVKVVNKGFGKIEKLCVPEDADVKTGDKLCLIQNPISSENIDVLKRIIAQVYTFLNDASTSIDSINNQLVFGNIQNEYNDLIKKLNEYKFFKRNTYFSTKMLSLKEQVHQYKSLSKIAENQVSFGVRQIQNLETKYDVDKKLYENKVIPKLEFLKAENDFIRQKQELENIKKYLQETRITELKYLQEYNDLEYDVQKKEREYQQSIKQSLKLIESLIKDWKQEYLIEAPISGKLFYLKNIIENQYLNTNEELFLIVPAKQEYFCIMKISSFGLGRVSKGQKVRIKLDNYPYHEFGQLIGKVNYVSHVPFQENSTTDKIGTFYKVIIEIDNSKRTTYNKVVSFSPEMTGSGEIETDQLTILKRLFYQVRGDFDY